MTECLYRGVKNKRPEPPRLSGSGGGSFPVMRGGGAVAQMIVHHLIEILELRLQGPHALYEAEHVFAMSGVLFEFDIETIGYLESFETEWRDKIWLPHLRHGAPVDFKYNLKAGSHPTSVKKLPASGRISGISRSSDSDSSSATVGGARITVTKAPLAAVDNPGPGSSELQGEPPAVSVIVSADEGTRGRDTPRRLQKSSLSLAFGVKKKKSGNNNKKMRNRKSSASSALETSSSSSPSTAASSRGRGRGGGAAAGGDTRAVFKSLLDKNPVYLRVLCHILLVDYVCLPHYSLPRECGYLNQSRAEAEMLL